MTGVISQAMPYLINGMMEFSNPEIELYGHWQHHMTGSHNQF